jgi:hypothetical protein
MRLVDMDDAADEFGYRLNRDAHGPRSRYDGGRARNAAGRDGQADSPLAIYASNVRPATQNLVTGLLAA